MAAADSVAVGLDHHVDSLADGVLVDLFNVNLEAINGFDRQVAVGKHLGLAQGLIGFALAFGTHPSEVAFALLVALLKQVFDRLKGHRASAGYSDVIATLQLGCLVELVPPAAQRQVTAGLNYTADILHIGHFIPLGFFTAPTTLFLHVVQRVVAVLRSQECKVAACHQIRLVTGGYPAGD